MAMDSDLIQNKLKPASLGTDRIENERIGLIFAKTIIFAPKTGSINSGTGETDAMHGGKIPVSGEMRDQIKQCSSKNDIILDCQTE